MNILRKYACITYSLIIFWCPTVVLAKKVDKDAEFITAHLLPEGVLKEKLDTLFSTTHSIKKAFKLGGFVYLKKDHTYIVMHPDAPEVLIKYMPPFTKKIGLFTPRRNVGRVTCADHIARTIEKYNLETVIVPRKWLYHIPGTKEDFLDSNYLVVAEKLNLVDADTNKKMWQTLNVQQEDELKLIFKETGFHDVSPDNIYFTTEGKLAFVDTEPRWSPMLRYSWLKSMRNKLLGAKGQQRLDELKESLLHELSEQQRAEVRRLEELSAATHAESTFDIANLAGSEIDEGNIEAAHDLFESMPAQVVTRGGGDLTLLERCDDLTKEGNVTQARLHLDKTQELPTTRNEIDFPQATRIIVLENHKTPLAEPTCNECLSSRAERFAIHTLPTNCISF